MRYGNIDNPDIIDTTCELVHDKFIDDYTKLLLHFDNGVVDSAKNATVTNNNVTFSTTNKFGGYSGSFNGTSSYLSLADSENWYFGNTDFTIDVWINKASIAEKGIWLHATGIDGQNMAVLRALVGSGSNFKIHFAIYVGNINLFQIQTGDVVSINTWHHIALVRKDTEWKIYVDGVAQVTGYYSGIFPNYTGLSVIGAIYNGGLIQYYDGLMDELRVSKGIARWTANFTPPTQSYDCPLDTQTKLLIHGGGPQSSTTFYDNSIYAHTLTAVGGSILYDSVYPRYKFRVSGIRMNGADYITTPDSADWNYGTGAFTVETWVRFNTVGSVQALYSQDVDSQNRIELMWNNTTNVINLNVIVANVVLLEVTAPWTPSAGVWYHLAWVRIDNANSSSSWKLFVNGTSLALTLVNGAWNMTMPDLAGALYIGKRGFSTQYFDGWLDEYRISKGIARWTSDFTPPTAPYDSPLTQYVIDGLDGDTDKEYRLITHFSTGVAGVSYKVRLNGDTGANYGYQEIHGVNASAAASRGTAQTLWYLYASGGNSGVHLTDNIIYAKTGKVRTMIGKFAENISGTTVTQVSTVGQSWNNTVDNVSTMTIFGDENGTGVGSRLILLKKRQLTTGTKTGEIDPAGFSSARTSGHWQLIYDNTLTAAKTNLMLSSEMDSYTKLLIHADGAAASTAFYDSSNSAHVITANGNAQVDTAQSKFGGASLLLDGVGDYLSIPDSSDWYFGTGDFTFDFWVRPGSSAINQTFISVVDSALGNNGISIKIANVAGGPLLMTAVSGGVNQGQFQMTSGWSFNVGQWYHLAFVRSGSNGYIFIDGVSQPLTQFVPWGTLSSASQSVFVGSDFGGVYPLTGSMDEVRISKGIARWTANFTPPTRAYNELDGDRDCVYKIITRYVNGFNGSDSFYLVFNNDTGSNYGRQYVRGTNTSVVAANNTGMGNVSVMGFVDNLNEISLGEGLLYHKSGFGRVGILTMSFSISGTTVGSAIVQGHVWNNTTDKNISILTYSSGASGLGIGTHVELWRLNLT